MIFSACKPNLLNLEFKKFQSHAIRFNSELIHQSVRNIQYMSMIIMKYFGR